MQHNVKKDLQRQLAKFPKAKLQLAPPRSQCGHGLPDRAVLSHNFRRRLSRRHMFRISRDTPAYYLTAVTKDRLPIFRTDAFARIMCDALVEAKLSGKFLIFAYVVMLDHFHLVTDSEVASKDILRFVKGIASRRIIDHFKQHEHTDSLEKLRIPHRSDGSDFMVWQRHPNTRLLWSEQMLRQRIQYTNLNPVRAELCDHPNDWQWSSARIWNGRSLESEPLQIDRDKIEWHR